MVADNVALIADKIFALTELSLPLLSVGSLAFGAQIYADFSAYTDIARGVAKWLGFELAKNFRDPYLASSPREFWKRWHISLSEWIRDYVYLPLGGSRVGSYRQVFNILFTFTLFGLWHGASWNFVLWGLYHGAIVLLYRRLNGKKPDPSHSWERIARVILMFVLVHAGWILFRSRDLGMLFASLTWNVSVEQWDAARYLFALVLVYSLPLWIQSAHLALRDARRPALVLSESGRIAIETLLGMFLVMGILAFSAGITSDFIYCQF